MTSIPAKKTSASTSAPRRPLTRSLTATPTRKATLPSCAECQQPLKSRDKAIEAFDKKYHPQCFKCRDCQVNLISKYFTIQHEDRKFAVCDRDYHRREGLLCAQCDQPIRFGDTCHEIRDKKFHVNHLLCCKCTEFGSYEDGFTIHSNEIYCPYHRNILIADKCAGCMEAIGKITVTDARNDTWHQSCQNIVSKWSVTIMGSLGSARQTQASSPQEHRKREKFILTFTKSIWKGFSAFDDSAQAHIKNAIYLANSRQKSDMSSSTTKLQKHIQILCKMNETLAPQFSSLVSDALVHAEQSTALKHEVEDFIKLLSQICRSKPTIHPDAKMQLAADGVINSLNLISRTILGIVFKLVVSLGHVDIKERFLNKIESLPIEREITTRVTRSMSMLSPLSSPMAIHSSLHPPGSIRSISPTPSSSAGSSDHLMLHSALTTSHGVSAISVEDLCDEISGNPEYASAKVLALTCHQDPKGVKHEFLIVEIYIPERNSVWLRLERAADKESRRKISFLSLSLTFIADDTAKVASSEAKLITEASNVLSRIEFDERLVPLQELERLLRILLYESFNYNLIEENCWFFCSVIQELLMDRYKGHIVRGKVFHKELGADVRDRIRARWRKP